MDVSPQKGRCCVRLLGDLIDMVVPFQGLVNVNPKVLGRVNDFEGVSMDTIWMLDTLPLGRDMQDLALLGVKLH